MAEKERLERVLSLIEKRGWTFRRCMEDDCESIDFEYRGVSYHIWEFHDEEWGVPLHEAWKRLLEIMRQSSLKLWRTGNKI